ncbi:hypothetical protein PTSG_09819 [Salpingoeca rosetta]|uniref:Uncharacterized protein n=1 Tax=Salpingoeca rosetta (strain ATCC 50818 / BSB-021) TaxID=946362 RepID=F2UP52_SALR5|nr:uncharacterized protein PTSG_09819 [Salpingoeca rosetta]EGD79407.1 hypothetical protein PTSG_09819 [Salpingoeca rosetta]|eukprot:XP_004989176.1 hypothetical protein PTSG_09819 [Salpingoeca rosetta]
MAGTGVGAATAALALMCVVLATPSAAAAHVLDLHALQRATNMKIVRLSDGSEAVADPKKPQVPPRFQSSIMAIANDFPEGEGLFFYDLENKNAMYNTSRLEPITSYTLNTSFYYLPDVMYYVANDVCKPIRDGTFYDMFDWVRSSKTKYQGKLQIDGRTCDQWLFVAPTATLTMCTDGNTPVLQSVYSDSTKTSQSFVFHKDFAPHPDPFDKSIFDPPHECNETPEVCPGPEEVETLDAYIFHPKNTTGDIVNQDVADLLGDVVFICTDALSNHTSQDQYEYVSHYKIDVVNKWGQYEQCNGYPGACIGDQLPPVGREASFGIKTRGGQCTNNTDVGSWFSLPESGLCPPGEKLSLANNCTWRINTRVKTIDGKCLLKDQGMLQSCVKEAHVPFPRTTEILVKAFKHDDKKKGGCPNVI